MNKSFKKLHFLFLIAAVVGFALTPLLAFSEDDYDKHSHERHDHKDKEGSLMLSDRDMDDFGIRLAKASSGGIREELMLPGEIRLNQNTAAHVSPRFSGMVTEIHKQLGDEVHVGETLAKLESNDTLRPFELTAPIEGTIVDYHITRGESLEAGEYAFVIADTSTVWADFSIYQRDLPRMMRGQRVHVSSGHRFPEVEARISYLGPVVNEETRTGLARVVLENPQGLLKPGLFITGQVAVAEYPATIVVPLSALHQLDGNTVVFVGTADGEAFVPRSVQIGRRDSQNAEVVRGLSLSEEYVAEGGFFLKAELQKESFGEGHMH